MKVTFCSKCWKTSGCCCGAELIEIDMWDFVYEAMERRF